MAVDMRRNTVVFLGLIFLVGCARSTDVLRQFTFTSTPPSLQTPLVEFAPTAAVTPTQPVVCAYVRTTHEDPRLTEQSTQVFHAAGLMGIEVRAASFGEDCLDTTTKKVTSFSAMQTDFYIDVPLQNGSDPRAMGDWVEKVMRALDQIPPEQIHGPNPGYVGIAFTGGGQPVNMWFPRAKAHDLLSQGTRGEALYNILQPQ